MSEKGIHVICIHLFLLIYIMYYNFITFFLSYFFFFTLCISVIKSLTPSFYVCWQLLSLISCVSCFISHLGKPRHSSFVTSVKFKPYAGMLMLSTTVKTPSQSPFLVLSSHFQNCVESPCSPQKTSLSE